MEFKSGDFNNALSLCHEASPSPDAIGQTVLFYAVQRSNDDEARQLAERLITVSEINPTRKDFGGQSPIFYAAAVGNLNTIKLLIQYGCTADEKDNLNQSPLFYASRDGQTIVVEYLLANGAVASDIDRNGQTPLFYAARENRKEICKLLMDAGASPNHRDLTGRRPSYFSKLNNHFELTEILDAASGPDESADDDNPSKRRRYRLVFVSNGTYLTPTVEQLDELEKKFPEICVWSKDGPIATGLAAPGSVTPPVATVSASARPSSGGFPPKKKQSTSAAAAAAAASLPKPIWMTAARQIVSDIFKKEDAWIFLRPVDPVKDQCADYLTVIKSPMDFATIRKKISKYNAKSDFLDDCELVFANCRQYNKPGTLPAVLCERVVAYYKQLLDQYSFDAIPDSTGSPPKPPTTAAGGEDQVMQEEPSHAPAHV